MWLFLKLVPRKILIIGAISALLASTVLGGIWYMKNLRAQLEKQKAQVAILESGVETQQQALKKMQADMLIVQKSSREYQQRIQSQGQRIREMQENFSRRIPEMQKLAQEQPAILETMINQEMTQARRCLEVAMGSEITPEEKNDPVLGKNLKNCSN